MALSNAERQKKWRDKRNELAKSALRNKGHTAPLRNKAETAPLRNDKIAAGTPKPRADLAEKIEPFLAALYQQGTCNVATISPPTVATYAGKLELALVEHGIIPKSKRILDWEKRRTKQGLPGVQTTPAVSNQPDTRRTPSVTNPPAEAEKRTYHVETACGMPLGVAIKLSDAEIDSMAAASAKREARNEARAAKRRSRSGALAEKAQSS